MAGIIGRLARTGLRRGLLDGSRGWLIVGISASAVEVARRVVTDHEVAATLELQPGDAVEIRVIEPKP